MSVPNDILVGVDLTTGFHSAGLVRLEIGGDRIDLVFKRDDVESVFVHLIS